MLRPREGKNLKKPSLNYLQPLGRGVRRQL